MKLILIINDTVQKEYKSLKEISKVFPDIEYHQLRQIYLQSTNKSVKKMHPRNQEIYKQIKIIDKPIQLVTAA